MYNAIKVEFRDHSQVQRIYKKSKTAEEAKALAMRWAKKLEAEARTYFEEPFMIWYGYVDYDGGKFWDGDFIVNE